MSFLHTLTVVAGIVSAPPSEALPTARASITLHLHAPADRAFPMFDPVNESLWDPQWRPTLLGDARVASGLVFTTQDDNVRTAWLLDRYDADVRVIRYVNVRDTTLSTIDITVVPDNTDASVATVTYTRTALDPRGIEGVEHFARHFATQAPHWEHAINSALDGLVSASLDQSIAFGLGPIRTLSPAAAATGLNR